MWRFGFWFRGPVQWCHLWMRFHLFTLKFLCFKTTIFFILQALESIPSIIKTRSDIDLHCIEGNLSNLPAYVFIIYPTTEEQHHNLSHSDNKGNGWQFWQNQIMIKKWKCQFWANFEKVLSSSYLKFAWRELYWTWIFTKRPSGAIYEQLLNVFRSTMA